MNNQIEQLIKEAKTQSPKWRNLSTYEAIILNEIKDTRRCDVVVDFEFLIKQQNWIGGTIIPTW